MPDLSRLFGPERVAVIGATDREDSVGRALMRNLAGFPGQLHPVNPGREELFGLTCYPSIGAVPDASAIDLAVVAVPAAAAVDAVREAGEAGVGNVVVITAGFGETGERGRERGRRLVEVAERYDLNLVGPNCLGVMSVPNGLNATFATGAAPAGSVSLLSQSGAVITAMLAWAERHGIGFKDVVSLGNEAVLDEVDFIEHWRDDPDTDVVLAYLEDVDDGQRFIETVRRVTRDTPVVSLKSGRTEAGARAAASHTGSIAGSDDAYEAAFRTAGVLRADTVQDAFDVAQALVGGPAMGPGGVAVVTNGGGPGVLAADALADSGLDVAAFEGAVRDRLAGLLPDETDVGNPLDIIGDADLDRYRAALDAVLGDDAVSAAVVAAVPTALFDFEGLADVITEVGASHGKPVVACLMGGEDADRAAIRLAEHDVPNYFDPARAVTGLAAIAAQDEVATREVREPATFDVDRDRARDILAGARERGVDYLGVEAMGLLDAYGIPTPAGGLAGSAEEAAALAEEIDGPVAMKIASPDIVHKSDVGGVALGVAPADAADAYRRIRDRATEHVPGAAVLGVRVEAMVDTEGTTETIVGASRDPQFGHLVMFGLGGVFVEVFEDTTFGIAPVTGPEARAMTEEIRAAPLLRGARGREPADVDAVVEAIQRVSQLVTDFPAIRELDVNPLIAGPDGVVAPDLRLTLDVDRLADPG